MLTRRGADVYVSTVGGARTVEPAIDLAMAISIVSSLKGVPPRADLVAVGEISLTVKFAPAPAPSAASPKQPDWASPQPSSQLKAAMTSPASTASPCSLSLI